MQEREYQVADQNTILVDDDASDKASTQVLNKLIQ